MKEELIIKVLSRASEYISSEQVKELRNILEEELYNYDVNPVSTALVSSNGVVEKIMVYLASKKLDGLSDKTLINYKRYISKFAFTIQKNVEDITAMDVRMYLAVCAKSGVKNSTLSTIISTLKSFFAWLENEDYIIKSPMRKIKTTKVEKRLRKALTQEELEMVRIACETPREKAMVEFFYSTGARLDEVYKLNKQDIDWSAGTVMVIGKGDKERMVYLNAKSKVYLKKYLNTRKDTNEALYVSERRPHGRLGERAIEKVFSDLGKRSGISKKIYPHLMRHTTATNMINNGASLSEVQMILGHSSPVTTEIYAQLNNEAIQISHKKHLA